MEKNKDLERFSKEIRCLLCEMLLKRKDGHIGGSLSIVEVMAVLFGKYIKESSTSKDWFVLSKGHAGPVYYATLALKGKIPLDQIFTLNENGTILPSHPDRLKTPGVDCTTGSLGQGISEAVGIAYGLKIQKKAGHVYCIIGDGECNEGEVWEALQFASNKKLNNLTIFIDDNKKQVDGFTHEISCELKFEKLMNDLGLYCLSIHGNSIDEIDKSISQCLAQNELATVIILNTVKGYGLTYFEQLENCHHMNFKGESAIELQKAIHELKKELEL